jgi:hypothetical protein
MGIFTNKMVQGMLVACTRHFMKEKCPDFLANSVPVAKSGFNVHAWACLFFSENESLQASLVSNTFSVLLR